MKKPMTDAEIRKMTALPVDPHYPKDAEPIIVRLATDLERCRKALRASRPWMNALSVTDDDPDIKAAYGLIIEALGD